MSKSIHQTAENTLPPGNNMGGKSGSFVIPSPENVGDDYMFIPIGGTGSTFKRVKVPHPASGVTARAAFIDQVSFTAQTRDVAGAWFTNADFARVISLQLEAVFGFGVTFDRGRGLNCYESAFILGDSWGFLCVGGQRQKDTFLVQITGQGATAAAPGWEQRLHDWLASMSSARITRVDLAHDDFTGQRYSPEQARDDYLQNRFTLGGRRPNCEMRGNWLFPDGSGLSFYVGSRNSGKLLRVYEKGKQLGGAVSEMFRDWVRTELELHNEGRVIPLPILINPGPYLAGAYPALAWVDDEQSRIATKQKTLKLQFDRAVLMVRNQVGRYIGAMVDVLGADELISRIRREGIPDRLIVPDYRESPPPLEPEPSFPVDWVIGCAFT
jgi:phage replication initiation protein